MIKLLQWLRNLFLGPHDMDTLKERLLNVSIGIFLMILGFLVLLWLTDDAEARDYGTSAVERHVIGRQIEKSAGRVYQSISGGQRVPHVSLVYGDYPSRRPSPSWEDVKAYCGFAPADPCITRYLQNPSNPAPPRE